MSVKSHERHTKKKDHTWEECGLKFPHFHAKLESIPLVITLKEVYFLGGDDELLAERDDDRSVSGLIPLTPVESLKSAQKNQELVKKRDRAMPRDTLLRAIISKRKERSHDERTSTERLEKIMDKVQSIEKELKSLKKSFVKYGPVYETRFASIDPDSSGTSRFTYPKRRALKPVEEILYGRPQYGFKSVAGTSQNPRNIFDRIGTHPRAVEFSRDSESLLMSMMSQNVYEKIKTDENQSFIREESIQPEILKKVYEKKMDLEKLKEQQRLKDLQRVKDPEKKKHSDKEKIQDKKKDPDKKKYSDKMKEYDRKKEHEKNKEKYKKKEPDKKIKPKDEENIQRKRSRQREGSSGSTRKRNRDPSPVGPRKVDSYDSHMMMRQSNRHREDINYKRKPYESSFSKFMDEKYAIYQRNKTRMKKCDEASRRRWLEILECLYTPRSAYRPSASSLQSISEPFAVKPRAYKQDGVLRGPFRVDPTLRMPSADRWPTKWVTRETDYTL